MDTVQNAVVQELAVKHVKVLVLLTKTHEHVKIVQIKVLQMKYSE